MHWLLTQVSEIASQALVVQSPSIVHFRPVAQPAQMPPPQSMSVSTPSFLLSEHWFETQANDTASQAFVAQSVSAAPPLPGAQVAQPPPQSTSVSVPSFLWSTQRLATHTPETKSQAEVAQSEL